jgi:hypothetical protein
LFDVRVAGNVASDTGSPAPNMLPPISSAAAVVMGPEMRRGDRGGGKREVKATRRRCSRRSATVERAKRNPAI